MYNKITNYPLDRVMNTFSCCIHDDAFSEQEIDNVSNYFSQFETFQATVGPEVVDETIRKSKVQFFYRSEETQNIFDKINDIIENVNERYYNFILNGYEAFQYTEYHSTDSDRYDYHTDMSFYDRTGSNQFETRKLSVVMCLNRPEIDFEGGDFFMNIQGENDPIHIKMKKGRIIFFPSFLLHRVSPVTKGIRKSLVTWVTGPKFR